MSDAEDLPTVLREITYTHACIGVGCLKCLRRRADMTKRLAADTGTVGSAAPAANYPRKGE